MNNNATNHTQYFGFPLFTGTDKPSVLTDWNGTMEELDNTLEDYRVRISGCEQTTQSFMDRLNVVIGQLNDLVARIQGDENIIEQVGLDIEAVNDALLETNASVKRALEELGDLRTTVTGQGSDISSLQTQTQANTSNISTIQGTIATLQSTVNSLQTSVTTLTSDMVDVKSRLSSVEARSDVYDVLYGSHPKQSYTGEITYFTGRTSLNTERMNSLNTAHVDHAPVNFISAQDLPTGKTVEDYRDQFGTLVRGFRVVGFKIRTDNIIGIQVGDIVGIRNVTLQQFHRSTESETSSETPVTKSLLGNNGKMIYKVTDITGNVATVQYADDVSDADATFTLTPYIRQFMFLDEIRNTLKTRDTDDITMKSVNVNFEITYDNGNVTSMLTDTLYYEFDFDIIDKAWTV